MSTLKTRSAKETAAHLFRIGGSLTTEQSFKLDSDLVFSLSDFGLRVQDLVACLDGSASKALHAQVDRFLKSRT